MSLGAPGRLSGLGAWERTVRVGRLAAVWAGCFARRPACHPAAGSPALACPGRVGLARRRVSCVGDRGGHLIPGLPPATWCLVLRGASLLACRTGVGTLGELDAEAAGRRPLIAVLKAEPAELSGGCSAGAGPARLRCIS